MELLNHKKPWTKEDADKMRELMLAKKSYKEIGIILGRSVSSCMTYGLRILKIKSTSEYRKDFHDVNFWSTPNKTNSYWAGFSAADGCLYGPTKDRKVNAVYTMTLQERDRHQLEQLKKDCGYTGLIRQYESKGFNGVSKDGEIKFAPQIRISGCYQWLKDLKENFNIEPRKTYRLGPPSEKLTFEQQLCYLVGLIDGDGCLSYHFKLKPSGQILRKHISINVTSASISILNWVKEIIDKVVPPEFSDLGKTANIVPRKDPKKEKYAYSITCMRPLFLYSFLKDLDVPKLARKWAKPEVLALLEEKKQKYPELFEKFKIHTDELLKNDGVLRSPSETFSGPNLNNYQNESPSDSESNKLDVDK